MNPIASQNAPSPWVVVPHFVIGGLTLLIVTLLIVIHPTAFTQHFFNPILLSITHLLALGFITMVIFGALYQLIPVIMEVKLFSEKLALFSIILLGLGAILLATSFWILSFGASMYLAGSIIVAAVGLFVINILVTAFQSTKNSIERKFIITAVNWLLFTVLAGLTLAINFNHPFLKPSHIELLKLHAHAGLVGWCIQLIIGVSSRLLPMFMVAHNLTTKKLTFAYYFINCGLISGMISLFMALHSGVIISVMVVILGIFCYLSFIFEAYQKRIKKQLDIGMKQSMLSFVVFVIPLVIGVIMVLNFKTLQLLSLPLAIAYGSTIVIGFFTSLIMGQTYKTLPFIIWLKVYRGKIGKVQMPLPKELYNEKVAIAQFWIFALGTILLFVGIITTINLLVSVSGLVLFLAVALYNFNIIKIIFHQPKNME